MDQISYGEARFYHSRLIRCQSYHGDYACSDGGGSTSGGDEMDFSTRVPVIRSTWAPMAMSYRTKHLILLFPNDPAPLALPGTGNPPGVNTRGSGTYRVESRG
jgi:hypothetical protein